MFGLKRKLKQKKFALKLESEHNKRLQLEIEFLRDGFKKEEFKPLLDLADLLESIPHSKEDRERLHEHYYQIKLIICKSIVSKYCDLYDYRNLTP